MKSKFLTVFVAVLAIPTLTLAGNIVLPGKSKSDSTNTGTNTAGEIQQGNTVESAPSDISNVQGGVAPSDSVSDTSTNQTEQNLCLTTGIGDADDRSLTHTNDMIYAAFAKAQESTAPGEAVSSFTFAQAVNDLIGQPGDGRYDSLEQVLSNATKAAELKDSVDLFAATLNSAFMLAKANRTEAGKAIDLNDAEFQNEVMELHVEQFKAQLLAANPSLGEADAQRLADEVVRSCSK